SSAEVTPRAVARAQRRAVAQRRRPSTSSSWWPRSFSSGARREQRRPPPGVHFRQNRGRRLKASDIDNEDTYLAVSSAAAGGGWLRIVGLDVAIVVRGAVSTFWNE